MRADVSTRGSSHGFGGLATTFVQPAQQRRKTELPWVCCGHLMLIGAMNPCPCGYYGDPVQECTCSNAMVSRYQARKRHAADLGAAAGPDRHPHRGAAGGGDSASRWKSCRTTGWASPRRRSAPGLGGDRPAAQARQAARFAGTRMLANAAPLLPQRRGRARCGTSAGWTTSLQDRDQEEPAKLDMRAARRASRRSCNNTQGVPA